MLFKKGLKLKIDHSIKTPYHSVDITKNWTQDKVESKQHWYLYSWYLQPMNNHLRNRTCYSSRISESSKFTLANCCNSIIIWLNESRLWDLLRWKNHLLSMIQIRWYIHVQANCTILIKSQYLWRSFSYIFELLRYNGMKFNW